MDKLMHPIGMWCKRGAWVILVIGVLDIVVGIYIAIQQTGASGGAPLSFMIADVLQVVLSIVPTFIFYSLILYAAGVIIDRFLVYTAGNSTKAKVGGVNLDEVEETAIKPTMVDAQESGGLRQDKVEDVIPQSSTAEAAEEESGVTQDKVEDVIPQSSMAEAAEEESGVTQDKVEDVISQSPMAEAAEEESDVTQDKVEDVISQSSTAEVAEEESDVTLTNEEASPIKPATVESNGKNSDMKLSRRRQRK